MVMNIALKRARKAQRRKQVVAEKRKAEAFEASLAGRVLRAAATPIQECLLTESLFETGIGSLILARGPTPGYLVMSSFLIDVFCLGVKDVMIRSVGGEEFEIYVAAMDVAAPLAPVDPSYARKLLRDAVAWAQSIGLSPHRDFAIAERLFGDTNAAACDVVFRFSQDGQPVYMAGPTETPSLTRRRIEHLQKTLGDDGFGLDAAE